MILITGATGHLGNVLARELVKRGKRVRALILPGEDCQSIADLPLEKVEGNILQPETLAPAMQGVDQVFHMAALVSISEGQEDLLEKVNVQGTRNMLAAARAAGVRRFIYTSSIHALTRPEDGVTIDETLSFDTQNPAGAYDRTKAKASMEVLSAVKDGLDAVIVCPTGVIGPFDYRRSELGELVLEWMEKKPSVLIDGMFDFVDVRDVAAGHIQAADLGKTGQTYILGGERISLIGIRQIVKELTGSFSPLIKIPYKVAMFFTHFTDLYYKLSHTRPRFTRYSLETVVSNSRISSQRARIELGYSPRTLFESLKDTVSWWRENRKKIKPSTRI